MDSKYLGALLLSKPPRKSRLPPAAYLVRLVLLGATGLGEVQRLLPLHLGVARGGGGGGGGGSGRERSMDTPICFILFEMRRDESGG